MARMTNLPLERAGILVLGPVPASSLLSAGEKVDGEGAPVARAMLERIVCSVLRCTTDQRRKPASTSALVA